MRIALQLSPETSAKVKSLPLPDAIGRFLESARAKGRREATLRFYEQNLDNLARHRPGMTTSGLTAEACEEWLTAAPSTRSAPVRWRALRAFLNWGCSGRTPCLSPEVRKQIQAPSTPEVEEPAFLAPDEAAAIIQNIAPRLRPAVALGLFAGLRPHEICRLQYSSIDPASRIIRVPAAAAKTGRARVLEYLPPTVWRFLPANPTPSEPICPIRPNELTRNAKAAGKFNSEHPWPHDAMRHSFATYHVALENDPGKTSLLCGWEGNLRMLHRHYRGLTTHDAATQYFAITPPEP